MFHVQKFLELRKMVKMSKGKIINIGICNLIYTTHSH